MIEINNVKKSYVQGEQNIEVLKGLSLKVEAGETVAITGPSGCGKTTLLSLLSGLERTDSGTLSINNTDITNLSEKSITEFRSKNLGIVFQKFHLFSHLNALENVSLPLEILKDSEANNKSQKLLDRVGLSHRLDHTPGQLSGGECQRVGLARALVTDPQIILADEPTGSLDANTGQAVMDLLFELVKQKNKTLVLVTHNTELAHRCDRVVSLSEGKII